MGWGGVPREQPPNARPSKVFRNRLRHRSQFFWRRCRAQIAIRSPLRASVNDTQPLRSPTVHDQLDPTVVIERVKEFSIGEMDKAIGGLHKVRDLIVSEEERLRGEMAEYMN